MVNSALQNKEIKSNPKEGPEEGKEKREKVRRGRRDIFLYTYRGGVCICENQEELCMFGIANPHL